MTYQDQRVFLATVIEGAQQQHLHVKPILSDARHHGLHLAIYHSSMSQNAQIRGDRFHLWVEDSGFLPPAHVGYLL